ncbi:hypothetical protein BGZ49_008242 [Haplosporangium sp. Z 27]|nr:hypothetical protein BGZ49_008242 [Haplosporangium sp. Z 27]
MGKVGMRHKKLLESERSALLEKKIYHVDIDGKLYRNATEDSGSSDRGQGHYGLGLTKDKIHKAPLMTNDPNHEQEPELLFEADPSDTEIDEVCQVKTPRVYRRPLLTDDSKVNHETENDDRGAMTTSVSCSNSDLAMSVDSASEAQNIQKGQDDLLNDLDDDIEALEEIAKWTPAQSSPFYEVAHYIYNKAKGKPAWLPSVPKDISTNHKQMFERAIDLLCKSDVSSEKEVLVLVSGIINTITESGRGFYLSEQIAQESLQDCMMYRPQAATQLTADFINALYPNEDGGFAMSIQGLQSFVYAKLAEDTAKWRRTRDDQERYVVLKLMNQILLWLEHSHFEHPVSEHVYVSAWSSIFNTLFASVGLRVIPGELGSKASKRFRQLTEQEFGVKLSTATTTRMARKVDQTLRVMVDGEWTGEVAIFESKPVVSDATCEKQHNKSIRLNSAILTELESHELDICLWYPIIAETRAASVDFYTIRRYEDVLGVGRATIQKCWIPTHSSQLKVFLRSGTIETLLGFRQHLLRYASEATAVLSANPPSPFPVIQPSPQIPIIQYKESTSVSLVLKSSYYSSTGSPPSTPPPSTPPPSTPPPSNIKRSKPFVMFSPSKSKKTKLEDSTDDDTYDDD